MSFGAGQHIRLQLWNDEEVVSDGILYPGEDIAFHFKDGPQSVTHVALTRITKEEVEELDAAADPDEVQVL